MDFERCGLHDILWSLCTHHEHLTLRNSAGELQRAPRELHEALYHYAKSIGVEIRLGQDVTEYWEDEENSVVGVVTKGERLSADVVIGADGIISKARTLVLGYDDKQKSSGYAIFRAWLDTYLQGIDKDPLSDYFVKNGDVFHG
ncbi:hypothetical protein ACEPAH_6374 [Sanghuangporus vaninii]